MTEIFWMIVNTLLGIIVLGIFIAALYLPKYIYRNWTGKWRFVALLPLAFAAGDLLFIIVGISIDSTSHNLWPLELMMASLIGVGTVAVVFVIRKIAGKIIKNQQQ